MPLLSVIRRGREQAKDKKAQDASAKEKGEQAPKVPYRHVPTHAAVDAISGAPNTFRDFDRAKILEQHRRRSTLPANVPRGKHPAVRHGSSLSVVSYPSSQAAATPIISRTGSAQSMPLHHHHPRMRASMHATPYPSYSHGGGGWKGKDREILASSPLSAGGAATPFVASDQQAGIIAARGNTTLFLSL